MRALLHQGCDYREAARRLGIPAGQAYLIATGAAADGGDPRSAAERRRAGALPSAQHLLGVPAENPTTRDVVHGWIRRRVHADAAMRAAGSPPRDGTNGTEDAGGTERAEEVTGGPQVVD